MIKWSVETRKLVELKAYELNPRRITEKGLNDLIKSLELFGLAEPIVINRDDTIIGGHARVQALKRIKGKEAKVEVYVPDRLLDEKEVQELCVRLNKNVAGAFDFDILANQYDTRDLVAWGFSEEDLGFGGAGEEEQSAAHGSGEGDRKQELEVILCPKCRHEFSVVEVRAAKQGRRDMAPERKSAGTALSWHMARFARATHAHGRYALYLNARRRRFEMDFAAGRARGVGCHTSRAAWDVHRPGRWAVPSSSTAWKRSLAARSLPARADVNRMLPQL